MVTVVGRVVCGGCSEMDEDTFLLPPNRRLANLDFLEMGVGAVACECTVASLLGEVVGEC